MLTRLRDQGIDVPVVVVTAHGSTPDVVAAMRLGAVDFIPKPLSPETLRRVVREALDLKRGPRDQSEAATARIRDEILSRARRAVQQGELDEADFFLRLAVPLSADSAELSRIADEIKQMRKGQDQVRTPLPEGCPGADLAATVAPSLLLPGNAGPANNRCMFFRY